MMAKIERFEDLEVWQKARELTKSLYKETRIGEFSRDYSLKDQIRRASVSVMSNIAEGFDRGGDKEFIQFLSIAKGSAAEIRSQLYAALDQEYITSERFTDLAEMAIEVSRMLSALMKYLNDSGFRGSKFK
jgi:four helix bundle protein